MPKGPVSHASTPRGDFQGDGSYTPIVQPANVGNKLRDAFEAYVANGDRWTETLGSGDIVALDGNVAAASYLVISKDPLSGGTETRLETVPSWEMPFEAALGLHMSQRTLGQEFAIELVSTETPAAAPAPVAIASVSQTTTTLTVTTATAHNLRPGMRIGIDGCADSRMNYPALVVATAPSATQFTATAGPGGTIPSVTAGPFASGSVFVRSALGMAPNGTSMIFENATATNASFYVRSEAGDALPSGTITGNHSLTVLSTASVQAVTAVGAYSFQPTNEFRLTQMIEAIQWSDAPVDTLTSANSRYKRSQVVPDVAAFYRLRIRAINNASLTRPVAQIVSAVKSGTTTATIVTNVPHGLTTADVVNIFGIRDQAASAFPNLTTATAVASIVNATTFTIVIGTAATVTSYGGYVARVNGGQVQPGALTQVVQSVSRTSNVLTAIGNAAWTGVSIGDYINLVGVRDNATGASVGVDGPYRVRDLQTTSMVLEPIGSAPTGNDIGSVNCGGGVIRRTDLRISFVRIMEFERQRVEMMARPATDAAASAPMTVQNIAQMQLSGTNTLTNLTNLTNMLNGQAAHDAVLAGAPVRIGARAVTANFAAVASGDATDIIATTVGAGIFKPYCIPEAEWNASVALTSATAAQLIAAGGVGLKRHVTAIQAINTGASAVDLILLDGATERWRLPLAVNVPVVVPFPTGIVTTANTVLNANLSAVGTVRINAQGYTAP
jgi:hypothetical protein